MNRKWHIDYNSTNIFPNIYSIFLRFIHCFVHRIAFKYINALLSYLNEIHFRLWYYLFVLLCWIWFFFLVVYNKRPAQFIFGKSIAHAKHSCYIIAICYVATPHWDRMWSHYVPFAMRSDWMCGSYNISLAQELH